MPATTVTPPVDPDELTELQENILCAMIGTDGVSTNYIAQKLGIDSDTVWDAFEDLGQKDLTIRRRDSKRCWDFSGESDHIVYFIDPDAFHKAKRAEQEERREYEEIARKVIKYNKYTWKRLEDKGSLGAFDLSPLMDKSNPIPRWCEGHKLRTAFRKLLARGVDVEYKESYTSKIRTDI